MNKSTHIDRHEVEKLAKRLRVKADNAYTDYIARLQCAECLGCEIKMARGAFGGRELKAHKRASEILGWHRAFSDAEMMVRELLTPSTGTKET